MLLVARHGRTAANAAGLLLGRDDPPLDEVGREQARRLGERLRGVSRVITSPLTRARETASYIGAPVTVDERWIELDYGRFDGMAPADVDSDLWAKWRTDVEFVPPGGESLAALGRRVAAACEELVEEASETDIAVVTHVSPIKAAMAWAIDTGMQVSWRTRVEPASILSIAFGPNGPLLCGFNDVAHLA